MQMLFMPFEDKNTALCVVAHQQPSSCFIHDVNTSTLVVNRRSFSLLADGYSFEATNKRNRKNTERQKIRLFLAFRQEVRLQHYYLTNESNSRSITSKNNEYYPVLHFAVKEG